MFIVADLVSLRLGLLYVETYSIVHKSDYRYRFKHTSDVCPVFVFCVNGFETVFRGFIFWRFSFLPPIVTNKSDRKI